MKLSKEAEDRLHNDLIKLGDMMGDGLHHEPGGAWIAKEYRRVCRALGIVPKRKRNTSAIDEAMAQRLEVDTCKCGAKMKQTRSGSLRAKCTDLSCGKRFQYHKAKRS